MFKQYTKSIFIPNPIFMHISPTRRCNLKCNYCYQYEETMSDMGFQEFQKNVDNLYRLGLSIISFTGGEPFLWKHLNEAIGYCTDRDIITHVTTNGSLLSEDKLDKLKKVGLDYLMVSVDAVRKKSYSKKTISDNPQIIDLLKYARSKEMIISWNAVLMWDNHEDVYELIEISKKERIPISIGIIVPPPSKEDKWNGNGLELKECYNNGLLKKIIGRFKDYKNRGYPIIEPKKYFENIEEYLNGEQVWDCSLAKKRSIQISPKSEIYWCSKLNLVSPYKVDSLNKNQFNKFRTELKDITNKCNQSCYSNCAYDGYYLQKHKFYFLTDTLPLFLRQLSE